MIQVCPLDVDFLKNTLPVLELEIPTNGFP